MNFVLVCHIFTDFKNCFTDRLSNKPLQLWLLKIPPHLKYVTKVPNNLALITTLVCDSCPFSDINDSQGSVVMHMRCDGIFSKYFAANLLENLTDSEKILKIA